MVLEDEAIQTENMFSKCLGIKYAKEFYKVFHDSFETKEEGMKHIYQMVKSDGDLTDNQKKLVRTCFIGFIQAMCKDTISIPLIGFVSSKKPNLSKAIKKSRLNRTFNDLYSIVYKSGFDFDSYYLPDIVRAFSVAFGYHLTNKDSLSEDYDILFTAALSRYAFSISPYDYANIWYIMNIMNNLSTLSYCTQETVDKYPWILDCARNYIKMINYIVVLEHNRLKEVNSTSH